MKKIIKIKQLVLAVVIAVIMRTFIVQAFYVSSGSMETTIMTGDFWFVNKLVYLVHDPQPNDIIVFEFPHNPTKDFMKRIVAIPGQTVEIRNKQLFVDGLLVPDQPGMFHSDPTILPADSSYRDQFGPVIVQPNNYFVMGDNRDDSWDSRFWGCLERGRIKGRVTLRYMHVDPYQAGSTLSGMNNFVRWITTFPSRISFSTVAMI